MKVIEVNFLIKVIKTRAKQLRNEGKQEMYIELMEMIEWLEETKDVKFL